MAAGETSWRLRRFLRNKGSSTEATYPFLYEIVAQKYS